ncbi:MAG TPA: dioxygenase [Alphaproteobacteria bacterium]|nr:dioxygenase [Alphaproteobacteria bacterium]
MIIENEEQLTQAVLEETKRTKDPRAKEILQALIKHLHAFAREVRLTEKEFNQAIDYVTALGQKTTESHNETRLIAGSLGLSQLVCLMNNKTPSANLLGPFWRANAPHLENGASLIRSPTPGVPLFFHGRVVDKHGTPIAGAEVDVWHASTVGLYENQDPTQAEWNLRGSFTTDKDGKFSFRSVKPAGYPVPAGGPTEALLTAQGRHPMRPAHLHALVYKPGFKTIASQVYSHDDELLETDAQFGVTKALIGHYVLHENEPAPAADVKGPWWSLDYTFVLEPGESFLPKPPVSAKAAEKARSMTEKV